MRKEMVVIFMLFIFFQFVFSDNESVKTKTSNLTIGGRLQTQYQYVDSNADINQLILRRARLSFSSQLTDTIYAKFQIEAGKQKFTMKDAYLGFKLKMFDVFVGQKHVPFSREALNSSKYLQMVERSRTSEFAPFRQMGIGIHGFALDKKIEFMAGIYNGAVNSSSVSGLMDNRLNKINLYHIDAAASASNGKYLYAARLDFHPLGYIKPSQSYLKDLEHPLLSFAINVLSSNDAPSVGHTLDKAEVKDNLTIGGDMAFMFKGFAGTFEYMHRTLSWWDGMNQDQETPQDSMTLQGGYMIVPKKVELTARYEWVKYDDSGLLMGSSGENSLNWITFGFNYFFEGHHTKIQLNYILKSEDMPNGLPELDNNTLLAQFAYYF